MMVAGADKLAAEVPAAAGVVQAQQALTALLLMAAALEVMAYLHQLQDHSFIMQAAAAAVMKTIAAIATRWLKVASVVVDQALVAIFLTTQQAMALQILAAAAAAPKCSRAKLDLIPIRMAVLAAPV